MIVNITCYTIENLLERYGLERVDYISLDVENNELPVLESFPFDRFEVDVWLIEMSKPEEIKQLMRKRGYEHLKAIGADGIFKKRKAGVRERPAAAGGGGSKLRSQMAVAVAANEVVGSQRCDWRGLAPACMAHTRGERRVWVCVCVYLCVYACVCMYMCTYMYIDIYMYPGKRNSSAEPATLCACVYVCRKESIQAQSLPPYTSSDQPSHHSCNVSSRPI